MKMEKFAEIRSSLGSVVKIADVKNAFPKMVGHVMRDGIRVDRGVYQLPGDQDVKEPAAESLNATVVAIRKEVVTEQIAVVSTVSVESLVPVKSQSYVPWGCYAPVLRVIKSDIFAPIYVIGESGNGKTLGVEQACSAARRECVVINITNETSEEDLIGSFILQNGDMVWKDGPVIVAMRRGAVLCLDEIDQARPSILALQTVLQGKPYYIKKTNEIVQPQKGFAVIATGNTKGTGDDVDRFSGAQILNEAFLDRFPIIVEQDYPSEAIERKILSHFCTTKSVVDKIVKFAHVTRGAKANGAIETCITTRRAVQICQNITIFGNEKAAVVYAVSRFNTEVRDMFVELYDKLSKELPEEDVTEGK